MPRKPAVAPSLCECGCGQPCRRPGTRFLNEHVPRGLRGIQPRPFALCGCGCGQPVKRHQNKYLGGHIPSSVKSAGGRKGGITQGYRRRALAFRLIADALPRHMTRQDLLEALDKSYWMGYETGHGVGAKLTRQNSQNSAILPESEEGRQT